MKRWHVLVIALIACSWIGTGAWWQVRENQRNALRDAMQGRNAGGGVGGGDFDRSQWRLASPEERKAAVAVITDQINAFKRGDFEAALKLQSTSLRANFASADAFGTMMKSNYKDFLTPKSLDFGRGRVPAEAGHLSIRVGLVAQDGVEIRAVYHLVRENKAWRVAGVSGGQRDSGRLMPYGGPGPGGPGGGGPGAGGPGVIQQSPGQLPQGGGPARTVPGGAQRGPAPRSI